MENHFELPRNHFFLNVSSEMDTLLEPLKRHGVTIFTYFRNYPNSSQICLSNHAQWVEDYYKLGLYESSQYQSHPSAYDTKIEVWPTQSPLPVFQVAREKLHSDHGITLIKQYENYCEFYFLSTTVGNTHVINFFINNIDLLERFIMYFTSRAEKLLEKSAQNKIQIPHLNNEDIPIPFIDEASVIETIEAMKIKGYRIPDGKFKNVKLSARELDCVYALANGNTAKQAAQRLDLSPRTVESYIDTIKDKLACYKKMEIPQLLFQSGLPDIKWFSDEY